MLIFKRLSSNYEDNDTYDNALVALLNVIFENKKNSFCLLYKDKCATKVGKNYFVMTTKPNIYI